MAGESKRAVLAAMGANAAIAISKFVAAGLTGSSAMFAEAGHSVADTTNQVFLLLGINLSDTKADEEHPHGYGKEGFFWSFLAAIFIFVAGATFAFYEGARSLIQGESHHRTSTELIISFSVLAVAAVFEVISLTFALKAVRMGAKRKGWSFGRFMRESPDATTKTVLWEDSAALTGLALAATGLTLAEVTGNEAWDGVASLAIGFLLAGVALMLGLQSRRLLLGAAANKDTRDAISRIVEGFPEVERAVRILTMQIGQESILVTGELQVQKDSAPDRSRS